MYDTHVLKGSEKARMVVIVMNGLEERWVGQFLFRWSSGTFYPSLTTLAIVTG